MPAANPPQPPTPPSPGGDRPAPRPTSTRPSPPPRLVLPASDEDLLAECEVETFRASGPGGQHVNTTNSAVRLRHRSGLVVTCQRARSQLENKLACLRLLRAKAAVLNHRDPPRKRTKPSRAAKARRQADKRQDASRKALRRRPTRDD